ncbi:hypothetical protein ANN_06715 [Periplaneta americana]|uniref:DNA repair protein REV1 n=1 Tax=Periplaneta americana TaxID=6978 RepID=A0ABQ8TG12_PERAM|nr:hypothetical protein ANN_06715 [Periplaneta americana]
MEGGYMAAKVAKLQEQFSEDTEREGHEREKSDSRIFCGVSIFVNGYTVPSADMLKRIMMQHGGIYHHYQTEKTTHIIASNLPNCKMKLIRTLKIVKPDWIVDSVKEGRLLDYRQYLLYTPRAQTRLDFGQSEVSTCSEKQRKEAVEQDNVSIREEAGKNILSEQGKDVPSEEEKIGEHVSCPETFPMPQAAREDGKGKHLTARNATEPGFLSEFYNNSRLHHISTMGTLLKQYVTQLRGKNDGSFPGRLRLQKLKNDDRSQHIAANRVIMHIDMDCFFVSVGLKDRPHLRGLPVAVTHGRGNVTPLHQRKGVNRAFEANYYRQKLQDDSTPAELELNETDSMSEIASCSYEARKCGIKNGMFLGNALKLCPSLQTIPYDFEGYKQVSYCLYDTVAEFTLEIEAVSCDEMYVDCTSVLRDTSTSPMQFGAYLRQEIQISQEKKCHLKQHVQGAAHKAKAQQKNQLQQTLLTQPTSSNLSSNFYADLTRAFVAANIPWNAIENPVLRQFLQKYCKQNIPSESTLRKNCLDRIYNETLASIREDIGDSYIWVSVDETSDPMNRYIANMVVGKLSPDGPSIPHLVCVKELSKVNSQAIAYFVNKGLQSLYSEQKLMVLVCSSLCKDKTGCTASAGFGSNRLQARMATKKAKPNGQLYLEPSAVASYMLDIPVQDLPGVGRTLGFRLRGLGVHTCLDLKQYSQSHLQKEFGAKTGSALYQHCRGEDNRPLNFGHQRKSVSAEVNYGIRFTNQQEATIFLRQLAEEVSSRLKEVKMRGRCITLKLLVRAKEAPVETAKYLGHGVCDQVTRSSSLAVAVSDAESIAREVLFLTRQLSVKPDDMRGIGIQVTHLERESAATGMLDNFLLRPNLQGCAVKSHVKNVSQKEKHDIVTSMKTTESEKGKVNPDQPSCSTEQPVHMGNIDREVLAALPKDIRQEVLQAYQITESSTSMLPVKVTSENPPSVVEQEDVSLYSTMTVHEVRMLVPKWVSSENLPQPCDVNILADYLERQVANHNLDDISLVVRCLYSSSSSFTQVHSISNPRLLETVHCTRTQDFWGQSTALELKTSNCVASAWMLLKFIHMSNPRLLDAADSLAVQY